MKKLIISIIAILLSSIIVVAQRPVATVSADLPGRKVAGLPRTQALKPMAGVIVVDIWVDQYGNVVNAAVKSDGTTISDKTTSSIVVATAKATHFNADSKAPTIQEGTLTYTFASSEVLKIDENAFAFMGIPIDGSKYQMITALEAKGFENKNYKDQLEGMFNGEKVTLEVSTNHGVVDRILVIYPYCSEANDSRIKYNTLLSRLNRSAKYVCINPRNELPADEEIYWNLLDNSKYYDAVYFDLQPERASKQWADEFKEAYQKYYAKPLVPGLSYEEMEEALFCLPEQLSEAVRGVVWFTMVDQHRINISYINFKNRPRGEDL